MSRPKPTKEQLQILGRTLRRAREAHGLTREQLAERIDCSVRWLQKLESGSSNPHWMTVMQLSGLLGIDDCALKRELGFAPPADPP